MIPLDIRVRTRGSSLDQVLDRLRHPMRGIQREATHAMRASVRDEIAGAYWAMPQGGRLPWAPTRAFGTHPAGRPLGGPSGTIGRAWAGGLGSTERYTDDSVAIGVDLPFISAHRGGEGQSADRTETRVRAKRRGAKGKPAMFWYLGMRFGVWISPQKLLTVGIRIPARRHATTNPELRQRLATLVGRHVVEGA